MTEVEELKAQLVEQRQQFTACIESLVNTLDWVREDGPAEYGPKVNLQIEKAQRFLTEQGAEWTTSIRIAQTLYHDIKRKLEYVEAHDAGMTEAYHFLLKHSDLNQLQAEVGIWGQKTFPNSTIGTIQRHLVEEAEELHRDLQRWLMTQATVKDDVVWPAVVEEFVDCFLIMCHLAHRKGFSLLDQIRQKFETCQRRRWQWDEALGYYKHIPEEESDAS